MNKQILIDEIIQLLPLASMPVLEFVFYYLIR